MHRPIEQGAVYRRIAPWPGCDQASGRPTVAFRKSPEDRAAEQAAYEQRIAEDAKNQARIKENKTAESLPTPWADPKPWLEADVAFHRGDTFLQVELPHSSVTGQATVNPNLPKVATVQRAEIPQDPLGRVEATGWRLEHASWVFIETGQTSRDKLVLSGQRTVTTGEVVGIYLFRRNEAARTVTDE